MPAQAGGWAVDAAVDIFFTSSMSSGAAPPAPAPSANARALEALYQRYKDPHGDMILAEGVGKFCEDLRVSPAAGCLPARAPACLGPSTQGSRCIVSAAAGSSPVVPACPRHEAGCVAAALLGRR